MPQRDDSLSGRAVLARMAGALGVLVGLAATWALLAPDLAKTLRGSLDAVGTWAEVLFVVGGALWVFLCAPAGVLYLTAGILFGAAQGTLYGSGAAALGATAAFFTARSTFGERVARLFAKHARLDRFDRLLVERGLWLTLLIRLSLVVPIGPGGWALGLTRIPPRHYLLTTPAVVPSVFVYAYVGDVTGGLVGRGRLAREPWEWAVLAAGLLATMGAAWLVARAAHGAWRGKGPGAAEGRRPALPSAPPQPDTALCPPRAVDGQGEPRRVGVEIEFRKLRLESAAVVIVSLWGGRLERVHERALRVRDTQLGDFRVELDSHALLELAEKRMRGERLTLWERVRGACLGVIARYWTPSEITSEPLPFERLPEMDRLVHALGRSGAHGTDDGLISPVGVHFNPSVPSRDPLVLRDYVRAYVVLREHLVDALDVDLVRHALRFATPYPAAYRRLVLDPAYAPALPQLIDDYLRYNATRNRGLDLLPLLASLDPDRVRSAIDDPRVKPRPTFHFRLPNSRVGDTSWLITHEWRVWLEVERLADDRRRVAELGERMRRERALPWQRGQRSAEQQEAVRPKTQEAE